MTPHGFTTVQLEVQVLRGGTPRTVPALALGQDSPLAAYQSQGFLASWCIAHRSTRTCVAWGFRARENALGCLQDLLRMDTDWDSVEVPWEALPGVLVATATHRGFPGWDGEAAPTGRE